ncbi:hypothetical protein A3Q56_06166 [Intoshia linei]|uniref:Protein UNC80 central region domain-containing protein n=1 Tax=Intoshia linei TaxID=1819745 RepID=A0A177AXE3_9BILA|nr:hypothetical protein A3Q56_06166 [Intoshia linei]
MRTLLDQMEQKFIEFEKIRNELENFDEMANYYLDLPANLEQLSNLIIVKHTFTKDFIDFSEMDENNVQTFTPNGEYICDVLANIVYSHKKNVRQWKTYLDHLHLYLPTEEIPEANKEFTPETSKNNTVELANYTLYNKILNVLPNEIIHDNIALILYAAVEQVERNESLEENVVVEEITKKSQVYQKNKNQQSGKQIENTKTTKNNNQSILKMLKPDLDMSIAKSNINKILRECILKLSIPTNDKKALIEEIDGFNADWILKSEHIDSKYDKVSTVEWKDDVYQINAKLELNHDKIKNVQIENEKVVEGREYMDIIDDENKWEYIWKCIDSNPLSAMKHVFELYYRAIMSNVISGTVQEPYTSKQDLVVALNQLLQECTHNDIKFDTDFIKWINTQLSFENLNNTHMKIQLDEILNFKSNSVQSDQYKSTNSSKSNNSNEGPKDAKNSDNSNSFNKSYLSNKQNKSENSSATSNIIYEPLYNENIADKYKEINLKPTCYNSYETKMIWDYPYPFYYGQLEACENSFDQNLLITTNDLFEKLNLLYHNCIYEFMSKDVVKQNTMTKKNLKTVNCFYRHIISHPTIMYITKVSTIINHSYKIHFSGAVRKLNFQQSRCVINRSQSNNDIIRLVKQNICSIGGASAMEIRKASTTTTTHDTKDYQNGDKGVAYDTMFVVSDGYLNLSCFIKLFHKILSRNKEESQELYQVILGIMMRIYAINRMNPSHLKYSSFMIIQDEELYNMTMEILIEMYRRLNCNNQCSLNTRGFDNNFTNIVRTYLDNFMLEMLSFDESLFKKYICNNFCTNSELNKMLTFLHNLIEFCNLDFDILFRQKSIESNLINKKVKIIDAFVALCYNSILDKSVGMYISKKFTEKTISIDVILYNLYVFRYYEEVLKKSTLLWLGGVVDNDTKHFKKVFFDVKDKKSFIDSKIHSLDILSTNIKKTGNALMCWNRLAHLISNSKKMSENGENIELSNLFIDKVKTKKPKLSVTDKNANLKNLKELKLNFKFYLINLARYRFAFVLTSIVPCNFPTPHFLLSLSEINVPMLSKCNLLIDLTFFISNQNSTNWRESVKTILNASVLESNIKNTMKSIINKINLIDNYSRLGLSLSSLINDFVNKAKLIHFKCQNDEIFYIYCIIILILEISNVVRYRKIQNSSLIKKETIRKRSSIAISRNTKSRKSSLFGESRNDEFGKMKKPPRGSFRTKAVASNLEKDSVNITNYTCISSYVIVEYIKLIDYKCLHVDGCSQMCLKYHDDISNRFLKKIEPFYSNFLHLQKSLWQIMYPKQFRDFMTVKYINITKILLEYVNFDYINFNVQQIDVVFHFAWFCVLHENSEISALAGFFTLLHNIQYSQDYVLVSPELGISANTPFNPCWISDIQMEPEKLIASQNAQTSYFTATSTRHEQQMKLIKKALALDADQKRIGREKFLLLNVNLLFSAAYESFLKVNSETENFNILIPTAF